jgi:surface antigen
MKFIKDDGLMQKVDGTGESRRRIASDRRRIGMALVLAAAMIGVPTALTAISQDPVQASTSVGGNDYPWGNYDGPGSDPATWTWYNPSGTSDLSPLGFGFRNCTDYAAYEINEQMGGNTTNDIKFSWSSINYKKDGNAEAWKNGAAGKWPVNATPAVGAVAWWAAAKNNDDLGHVAIVASIEYNSDGSVSSIVVDDYNGPKTGSYDSYTITPSSGWPDDFIHIADISAGSSARDWSGVPGTTAAVATSREANGALEVFLIGQNGALYTATQSGPDGSWSGYTDLGGSWPQSDAIGVGSEANGALQVFLIGENGALYTTKQTSPNGSWQSSFNSWAGTWPASDAIGVGSEANGALEVFLIGENQQLYTTMQNGPNGSWVGYYNGLGGVWG